MGFAVAALALGLIAYGDMADNYLFNDDFLWLSSARYDMDAGNLLIFRVIGFFRPMINASFFATERIAQGSLVR